MVLVRFESISGYQYQYRFETASSVWFDIRKSNRFSSIGSVATENVAIGCVAIKSVAKGSVATGSVAIGSVAIGSVALKSVAIGSDQQSM